MRQSSHLAGKVSRNVLSADVMAVTKMVDLESQKKSPALDGPEASGAVYGSNGRPGSGLTFTDRERCLARQARYV